MRKHNPSAAWNRALFYAVPIVIVILSLFYIWFAIADRYIVFLYDHDMGPQVPDTSPFSIVTGSRYWMAGLVADGAILTLYTLFNLALGLLLDAYQPPAWWRVWGLCALPLVVGVPLITMTVNAPTLPPRYAFYTTAATLAGLALALMPGRMAARAPGSLLLLAIDGGGLMWITLNAAMMERLSNWLRGGKIIYVSMVLFGLAFGTLKLLVMTGVRHGWHAPIPSTAQLCAAGACVNYLLLPLLHHAGFTDGYYYISNSDNFFARTLHSQLAAWILGSLVALGITRLRQRMRSRAQPLDILSP